MNNLLKTKKFALKGACFCVFKEGNYGLLDFQKSQRSTADEVLFTINIGICSMKLLKFFHPDFTDLKFKPRIVDCHWRERIGFLLPEKDDKWWSIPKDIDLRKDLLPEIREVILQLALPKIEAKISDEMLVDEWVSDRSPGLTDIQRLTHLLVLLKNTDKESLVSVYVDELKRKLEGNPMSFIGKQVLDDLHLS